MVDVNESAEEEEIKERKEERKSEREKEKKREMWLLFLDLDEFEGC